VQLAQNHFEKRKRGHRNDYGVEIFVEISLSHNINVHDTEKLVA
jgi:hypothetical protein